MVLYYITLYTCTCTSFYMYACFVLINDSLQVSSNDAASLLYWVGANPNRLGSADLPNMVENPGNDPGTSHKICFVCRIMSRLHYYNIIWMLYCYMVTWYYLSLYLNVILPYGNLRMLRSQSGILKQKFDT